MIKHCGAWWSVYATCLSQTDSSLTILVFLPHAQIQSMLNRQFVARVSTIIANTLEFLHYNYIFDTEASYAHRPTRHWLDGERRIARSGAGC